METVLQNQIDSLIERVEKTNQLVDNEHITGSVFEIIENTEAIRIEYDNLCESYDKDKLNQNIGKRIREYFGLIVGEQTSAKSKTSLVGSYTLLYKKEVK